MLEDEDERKEELSSLSAIFPELHVDPDDAFKASIDLAVTPSKPLLARFVPVADSVPAAQPVHADPAQGEKDTRLSHLPPVTLRISLPDTYPTDLPPKINLFTEHDWLPHEKLLDLEEQVQSLWEEHGHCQILFVYIDFLQQLAERGFDLNNGADGCLVLPAAKEKDLSAFNESTKQAIFDAGTYDCGICLEPKRGRACHKLKRCGHVFCKQCLRDFFNNAITEGDVAVVKCLAPDCGKNKTGSGADRPQKRKRSLHPQELLAMGVEEAMVRRYVEMQRKKRMEADSSTVYCPRQWCQAPAKSSKYPPIPADLSKYPDDDSSDAECAVKDARVIEKGRGNATSNSRPDPSDRLAVCEKCSLAFCKVCFMGWHGPFVRCFPRDPNQLSEDEKASYDWIRLHTSPCPTCSSPTQKTMGCNHMNCFQCNTHFCYLCGSWLDGQNPYRHFNNPRTGCYRKLWELRQGDEQQAEVVEGERALEQMAIDAARQAQAEEAAALLQVQEDENAARAVEAEDQLGAPAAEPVIVAMARVNLGDVPPPQQPPRRRPVAGRQHNLYPVNANVPAPGRGQAVREYERRGRVRNGRRNNAPAHPRQAPSMNDEERQRLELQRFLEMAQRDEEDGWDSDELGDDDEGFIIR